MSKTEFTLHLKRPREQTENWKTEFTLDLERLREQTEKFEKVDDHVYVLQAEENPEAVIVLFHGLAMDGLELEHAFWSTWRKKNTYDCWPITLLPEYLDTKKRQGSDSYRIRVLAMFYESRAEVPGDVENKSTDRYLLSENFVTGLITSDLCRRNQANVDVPIFLVGHDLGGILIKNFIMYVEDQCSKVKEAPAQEERKKEKMLNFLANLKAVFFYATPHSGSQVLEDLAKRIPEGTNNQLLKLTRCLGKELARINADFAKYRAGEAEGLDKPKFNTFALVPTLHTNQRGFSKVMVVQEGSARFSVDDYLWVAADHFEVCQTEGRWACSLKELGDKVHEEISKYRDSELERSRRSLMGVEPLLKEAESHLRGNAFLGLVGRGGVGKTALARYVFETLCEGDTFEYTCFLELRRGQTKDIRLQVEKNMHHNGKLMSRSDKVYSDLWTEVIGKKLLLVFDDISQVQQAELLQEIADDNARKESRFIATGRYEQLLRCLGRRCQKEMNTELKMMRDEEKEKKSEEKERIHILRVDLLAFEDARKLFMVHAFPGRQEPPDHLRNYVENVVHECDGLPLSLKIMGGCLRKVYHEDKWKSILESLQAANAFFFFEERLWGMFSLSFDLLELEEKQMFLDVACLLLREDCPFSFEEVRSAWSSMHSRAAETWQMLLDRSLVAEQETRLVVYNQESTQRLAGAAEGSTFLVGNASKGVHMQKDLRTFGERVAEEMGRYYILDNLPPGRAFTVDTLRMEGAVALRVDISDSVSLENGGKEEGDLHNCRWCKVQKFLYNLKAVRYLELRVPWDEPCISCKAMGGIPLPNGLSILHWSGYNRNIQLSSKVSSLKSLAVLKLDRQDECCRDILSPEACLYLSNLERLELVCNDRRLPDEFRELRRLRHLEIRCEKLTKLPETFGRLSSLRCLKLHHCKQLRSFPWSFWRLDNLEILALDSCIQFQSFPYSFVDLSSLVDLSLSKCINLRYLPEDFGDLSHLRRLSLDYCGSLEALPGSFGELTLLETLTLDHCWELKSLPERVGNLLRLQTLSLGYCLELEELPESLGNLSALEILNLDHCTELRLLPSNFGNLSCLRRLNLEFCPKLRTLPETFWDLSRLERLSVRHSPQLEPYLEKSGVYPFWRNSD